MRTTRGIVALTLTIWVTANVAVCADDLLERVQHAHATNPTDQTSIHYVSVGDGPLIVFVHGFPDFWYSWADQMRVLSSEYRCVALDLRGYNQSDQPAAEAAYKLPLLVQDVMAVITACGAKRATVVGHDWGGAIAWGLALSQPETVDKLVICNLPHPRGLQRELLINDEHRANTQYARDFQDPEYHRQLTPEGLVTILTALAERPWNEQRRAIYLDAFRKSSAKAMLSYYRQNYDAKLEPKPPLPYVDPTPVVKAQMPVLMFHGLRDKALHHHALNNTWEWVEQDLTIVTYPEAGHWVHHDESQAVTATIQDWLRRRQ